MTSISTVDRLERQIFDERRRRRRRDFQVTWLIRIVGLAAFLGIWQLVVKEGLIDPLLISSPQSVAEQMVKQVTNAGFWADARATFTAAISGLVVGSVLGIWSGFVLSRLPVLDRAVNPFLTLMNSLPRAATAPIFILWFGLGSLPKIIVAASIVFFLMLNTTRATLAGLDHDIDMLTRSLAMRPRQRFMKIDFPNAMPSIFSAMRLGAVYSVLGVVVSEMVSARAGLGQRMVTATNNFQVDVSFTVLLAMGLLSMLLDLAVQGLQWVWTRK